MHTNTINDNFLDIFTTHIKNDKIYVISCSHYIKRCNFVPMKRIILITGGQRSGKSEYAENMALKLSEHPVYMATAHIWDEDFKQRVKRHQERRGDNWTTIEEEQHLSRHDVSGRVVVIDCITLWLTNFFYIYNKVETTLEKIKEEFDKFTEQDATFIFVTNEIGLGGIASDPLQRQFTDLQGWMNQYVAEKADEVVLMVSGIAVDVKRLEVRG